MGSNYRIVQGNDFKFSLHVYRVNNTSVVLDEVPDGAVLEDLTQASNVFITVAVPTGAKFVLPCEIDGNVVTCEVPVLIQRISSYHALLDYDLPDSRYENNKRHCRGFYNDVFQIVKTEAEANVTANIGLTVSINAVIKAGLDGQSAYEIWKAEMNNNSLTVAEFLAYLQKPATDAVAAGELTLEQYVIAAQSAQTASEQAKLAAQSKAVEAFNSAGAAAASEANALDYKNAAALSETKAKISEDNAKLSETRAGTSEVNSKASETNAAESELKAGTSELNAKTSEEAALLSEQKAKESEDAAKLSETKAAESESKSKTSETNAADSEQKAGASELAAKTSQDAALLSEQAAKESQDAAKLSEQAAKASEIASAASSKASSVYNVTAAIPLAAGSFYTASTARAAVPTLNRVLGAVITYATANNVWYTEKYIGTDVANWTTSANWERVPDNSQLVQIGADLNQVEYSVNGGTESQTLVITESNFYINQNGDRIAESSYCYGYIPISKLVENIIINGNNIVVESAVVNFVDANKTHISNVVLWSSLSNIQVLKENIPSNAGYLCISCPTLDVNKISVYQDVNSLIVKAINNDTEIEKLKTGASDLSAKIEGGTITKNFNISEDGFYYSAAGDKIATAGFCYGYALIDEVAENITINGGVGESEVVNFVDANKIFISNLSNWGTPPISVSKSNIPITAKYVCISCENKYVSSITIIETFNSIDSIINAIKEQSVTDKEYIFKIQFSSVNLAFVKNLSFIAPNRTFKIRINASVQPTGMSLFLVNSTGGERLLLSQTLTLNQWYSFVADNEYKDLYIWSVDTNIAYTVEIKLDTTTADFIPVGNVMQNLSHPIFGGVLGTDIATEISSYMERYDSATSHTRDLNPKFIKGLHLDCGRKYFSPANIKILIDNAALAGLNTFVIYFSDNEGFRFGLDDMIIRYGQYAYDFSSALGDGNAPTDGTNKWLTQTEMDDIISYANNKGLDVIPAFDMPGHTAAIGIHMSGKLQGGDDSAIFIAFLKKYAAYFSSRGCKYYNICGDETQMDLSRYTPFIQRCMREIAFYNMTPIIYNDEICKLGFANPYIDTGAIVLGWIKKTDGASYSMIDKSGYRMINAKLSPYYWTLGYTTTTPALVEQIRTSDIFLMADGSRMTNIAGAIYHIWCDHADADGVDEGANVVVQTAQCIAAFGEACNNALPNNCVITTTQDGVRYKLVIGEGGALAASLL